jgi:tRNA-splicing ligase RtcB
MHNIFGSHDENTLIQFRDVESRAVKAALMSDGHVGYVMPIGGVAAYDNQVSVVGVGFDIACGNAAIKTDMKLSELGNPKGNKIQWMLEKIADKIQHTISFGIGRSNLADDAPIDHPLFESDDWFRLKERAGHGEMRKLKDKARDQLGTVGSGNHYVDVFADEEGWLWVGVHFGSRGFGHGIATGFLNASINGDWAKKAPEQEVLLNLASSLGQDYWALMNLAGEYAYAGREWVARKVVEIIGAKEVELVHNHHNFAWKESHYIPTSEGDSWEWRDLIVVRKGATPAASLQKGFVGGSMGDMSVILEGTEACSITDVDEYYRIMDLQNRALFSTVHGAGRVMSRTQAAGKWKVRKEIKERKDGTKHTVKWKEQVKPGVVSQEMQDEWLKRENVISAGWGIG